MKKDLTIILGLFAIVVAAMIFQSSPNGLVEPGFLSFQQATPEAKVSQTPQVNNTTPTTVQTISNLKMVDVKILRLKVSAEVADTKDSRALGLGGRESIAADHGMLFVFDSPAKHQFWMKNVKFPIDIIWLDKNKKVIFFVKNAQPDSGTGQLDIYTPPSDAKYVLETKGGQIDLFGIEKDAKAEFQIK